MTDPHHATLPVRNRRAELAAFLRSRRERMTPQDAGLPPGLRRRTPGLRREEVAQLAGVGVTWYTWLEQGRPINASVQVLEAIARTLRLDPAERDHLYRLSDLPQMSTRDAGQLLDPDVQTILDNLDPLPAAVFNRRFDLLAWNRPFESVFTRLVQAPPDERNALWQLFCAPRCCSPMLNARQELPLMVAMLRAAFAEHVGEPAWTCFVARLTAASPTFAQMWATHDVADYGTRTKAYRHHVVGDLHLRVSKMTIEGSPGAHLSVYTPSNEDTLDRLALLRERPIASPHCPHSFRDHDPAAPLPP